MQRLHRLAIALAFLYAISAMPAPSPVDDPGTYSFSYDTGTGGYHQQQASGGSASGKYGVTGPGGSSSMVSYSTGGGGGGAGGFGNGGGAGGGKGTYNLNLNPGGIYSYDYQLSDQSKSESRGADGKVKGMFSFKGKDGQQRTVTYTADEGGFQPVGDHLPTPDANGFGGGNLYGGGAMGGGGSGLLNLNLQPGGVYSYDFALPDQSKSESRGADGKVKGQFSYKDKDGKEKSIRYTADEGGFQPVGDHIPKPENPAAAPSAGGFNGGANIYGAGGGGSVQGMYDIMGMGLNQKSSYSAGAGGFVPIHSISINLGGD